MSTPQVAADGIEKSLLRMAAPLIVSFWMRSLFTLVDIAYASRLPDADAAIAAIGLTSPLEFLYIATWVGVSTALTSYLSKAMGQGDNARFDQLLQTVRRMLFVLIPTFYLIALVAFLAIPHLGLDPAVARNFRIIGPLLVAGMPTFGFWSVLPDSVVKAHHDTRSTMMAGITSNLINVGLNTVFTFVFHWGIFGIGFSTVLGNIGGLIYARRRAGILEKGRRAAAASQPAAIEPPLERPTRMLLKLAVPASITYLLMAGEGILINALLAGDAHAKAALAAYSIYYRVSMFCVMPVIATVVALLPFTARYLGQGKVELVRRSYLEVLALGAVYSVVVLTPALWFGASPLLHWLAKEPETMIYGLFALRLIPVANLLAMPFLLSRPVFEGSQQGRPSVVMAILRYVSAIPLAMVGMFGAEALGQPRFYGLMLGLILATTMCSGIFLSWTLRFLRSLSTPRPPTVGTIARSYAGT